MSLVSWTSFPSLRNARWSDWLGSTVLLMPGALLAGLAMTSAANAACSPTSAATTVGGTVTCTGTTTNADNGGIDGYGTFAGAPSGITINVLGGASVVGTYEGISVSDATVNNYGTITGTQVAAIGATGALTVANMSTGMITGANGISSNASTVNVTNSGAITVTQIGIAAFGLATVMNQTGGTVNAIDDVLAANVAVTNSGTLTAGASGYGVYAIGTTGTDTVTNTSGGTISGGRTALLIGRAQTTGSTATIINSGSLVGSQAGVVINGSGSLTNNAGGIITGGMDGINATGSGMTIVNAGTITSTGANPLDFNAAIIFYGGVNTLTLASTSVINGIVAANATDTLQLGGTGAGMFDGSTLGASAQYQGFGTLNKVDASTWTLTGTSTFAGAVNVNSGTLNVTGSIASASSVTVNSGGTLSGTGTVAASAIGSGGTLSPGTIAAPYGTFAVTGPLTFASGSFYDVAITPTQTSLTAVTGATSIGGGTVQVTAGSGTYQTRQYTILTSTQGVTGQFASVTTNLAFLTPTLAYDGTNVYLDIAAGTPTVAGTPTYTTAPATRNQYSVASGLTIAGTLNGGTGPILNALNQLTVPQAQAAFESLSGEGIVAAQNAAHRQVSAFTSSIFDQTTFYGGGSTANSVTLTAAPIHELADLPSTRAAPPPPVFAPVRTWRAWATGFGGAENLSGQAGIGSATQRDTIYGGTLGVDYQVMPNYLAGVAIGGSDGEFNVAGRSTSGSTTGGHIAFYDLATFGAFYGASTNSASFFTNKTTRTVAGFGGLAGETDRGTFDSHEFRTRLEFGRHFGATDLARFGLGGVLTPFVALEIAELRSNGFSETSLAGPTVLGLNVQGQSSASVPSFVGLRYQGVAALGNGMVLSPSLQLAYVHEFAPQRTQFGTLTSLPGSTFLVDGARPSRNAVQAKAGAEMAIGPHSVIFATFDGEFSGQAQFYGGKGGFKYLF